jgi:hypothetical protein
MPARTLILTLRTHRAYSRDVSIGMDLLLCAVDASSGQARFGPKLSYALPVAELVYLADARRVGLRKDHLVIVNADPTGEPMADSALADLQLPAGYPPLTVQAWAGWRGPRRIDPYLRAAADAGILKVVTEAQSGRKTLTVVDPEPINQVTRRLIAVVDDPAPGFDDVAFAVLADAAGIAQPHLQGRDQRRRRARLSALRNVTGDSDPAQVLRPGLKAITELSRLATADPAAIDQRIGLTPAGRTAEILLRP